MSPCLRCLMPLYAHCLSSNHVAVVWVASLLNLLFLFHVCIDMLMPNISTLLLHVIKRHCFEKHCMTTTENRLFWCFLRSCCIQQASKHPVKTCICFTSNICMMSLRPEEHVRHGNKTSLPIALLILFCFKCHMHQMTGSLV